MSELGSKRSFAALGMSIRFADSSAVCPVNLNNGELRFADIRAIPKVNSQCVVQACINSLNLEHRSAL